MFWTPGSQEKFTDRKAFGIPDSRESQIFSVQDTEESQIAGFSNFVKLSGVPDTGYLVTTCQPLGYQGVENPWYLGYWGVENLRCSGHQGV